MIKIEIKNRFTGSVIFEYTKENNTIKETVEKAYLSGANLSDAYLSVAYLSGAYLSGAYLSEAYLSGAVKIPMYCKWTHGITENKIHIGCEKRSVEEWDIFFNSNDVITTKRNTDEFKQIQAVFEAYKSYLNFLNGNK